MWFPALAQQANFPTKPVTIVTAFPAGSGPDAVLRQVSGVGLAPIPRTV